MEGLRKNFVGNLTELSSGVAATVAQVSDISHNLETTSTGIFANAEKISNRFADISHTMKQEAQALVGVAERATNDLLSVAEKVEQHSGSLKDQTAERSDVLRKAAAEITTVSKQVAQQTYNAIEAFAKLGQSMEKQALTLATAADGSLEKVDASAEKLLQSLDAIQGKSSEVTNAIQSDAGILAQQNDRFLELVEASLKGVEVIRESSTKAQNESFLSAAKFIIEGLNSLSVDFSRIMDPEIPDKMWKAYHRGDSGVFTRRIVSMREDIPMERIATKYEGDSEFRGYIQRYVRMFEELYDQADGTDHGDLLVSTLMTSDVGKLYLFLCMATGRERPKSAKDKLQ